jgi:transcriptional regulator with XRE-family HTH domain
MDASWFKSEMRRAGVTAADIAGRLGRDRTVVSHILNDRQQMSLPWAQAFAEAMGVDVDQVLEKAGAISAPAAQTLGPGFRDSDVVPFIAKDAGRPDQTSEIQRAMSHDRPGVDTWTVKSRAMMLGGVLQGDMILVDSHAAVAAKAGDLVIAQTYDLRTGTATTVLRRYEPPVLIANSPDEKDLRVHVVDGTNVVIMGRVIAQWRVSA